MTTDDGPRGTRPLTWLRAIRDRRCRECRAPHLQHRRNGHDYADPLSNDRVKAAPVLAVAAVLASVAKGDTGRLFISQVDLAALTGTSTSTVKRALGQLQTLGYLLRTSRGSGRSGDASTYLLTLPGQAAALDPMPGSHDDEHMTVNPETGEVPF